MESSRNDSQNRNNKPDGSKRPKSSIWVTLIISVAIVLIISMVGVYTGDEEVDYEEASIEN